jgi:two-component system, LytTR family, sensor kinase
MDAFTDRQMMNQSPSMTKSFELEGLKNLQLDTFSGDIEIVGHDSTMIKVEVYAYIRSILTLFLVREQLSEQELYSKDLSINIFGDTLKIWNRINFFNPLTWLNSRKTSFRVFIPKTINSYAKTYGGDISIKNVSGNHAFTTWGGDLSIEDSKGDLKGKTMGGDIDIVRCEGNISGKTMGGDIHLSENKGDLMVDSKGGDISTKQHNGQVRVNTWGGSIETTDLHGSFECSTMGGNIRLQNVNGNIGASTKGGNITVNMPSIHQYAWFDTSGGNIKIALPLDYPIDFEISGSRIYHPPFQNFQGNITHNNLYGKLNGGGKHITAKTRGGRVIIENTTKISTENNDYFADNQNVNTYSNQNQSEAKTNYSNVPKPVPASNREPLSIQFKDGFFAFLFCVLLVYGLSAVAYFTLEFFNAKSALSVIYKGIFYTNINHGIGALVSVYVFINLIEFKIQSNISKYIVLIAITSIYTLIFQFFMGVLYWSRIDPSLWDRDQNNYGFIYLVIPQIVSCAYFFYWQRTRSITRKMSEQEYQLLNLEKLKSKAQLDALEARINPHFLYNSLNSIAGLIHDMPDKAEEMTIQLSKLFRYTTGRDEENLHTFADELEIIKAYLAIEQVRFGKRLSYEIDCDEAVLNQQIPRFLLQPLVENAIKHGISKIAHAGEIKVEIKALADNILIKIHDNGPDFGESFGGGFGLRSIKEKLQIVYGNKATIDLKNQPEKAVIITLPDMGHR